MKKDLEMEKFYVYVHTCNANGKKYVGCTKQARPELRWVEGKGYRYNKHFYSAILKYGWDNFEHEVFEVESEEEMYRKEVELISFYHSNDPKYGYNHSVGGEHSSLGCTRSEEFRKKVSETLKGKPHKPHSVETRKKISEAVKKNLSDPEFRKKLSEANKKSHSDLEFRRKVSEAHKGKPRSEEFRKKMSEARKREWSDPEVRRKRSEALKGKHQTKIKIKLQDGTIVETTKNMIVRWYVNKGKKFEYLS